MIGKNVRGIRHLWRLANASPQKILVMNNERGQDIADVFKVVINGTEKMFILNELFSKSNYEFRELVNRLNGELQGKVKNCNHSRILEVYKVSEYDDLSSYSGFFTEIYLLPETFEEDYETFLRENAKMVGNLSSKYGFHKNDLCPKILYMFCNGSKNFFEWAVNIFFHNGTSFKVIQNILSWNDYYSQLSKNLSKGTITAYKSNSALVALVDELTKLRNEKRMNDAINSFNTTQKKILKSAELSEKDKETLSKFSKLSETKRINFIKKVSTITDFQELMRQMRHITSVHFEWNKASFMDYLKNVEGIQYEVIADKGDIVLVKVNDYETVKQLGKTTNWCISKNKSYWDSYVEREKDKTNQFMIFDFSKLEDDNLSIIGLTAKHNKGITSAHNFINENLIDGNDNIYECLNSYLSKFNGCKNIYKILENCGIDLHLVINFDKPPYEWERGALMEYLYECVNSDNVDVIFNEGDKLILSVRDENIKYFFGDTYIDNIPSEYWPLEHIIFIDFSKNKFDTNKVQFAIISSCSCGEDYANCMYNESSIAINVSFDSKVSEFNAPYDIIRRPNNLTKRITNAFYANNIKEIKKCLSLDGGKKAFEKSFNDEISCEELYTVLVKSLEIISFDYLNLFYENGYKLSDFLQSGYVGDLLKAVITNMARTKNPLSGYKILEKVCDSDIEMFYNNKLDNKDLVKYIGSYLLFKKIIENEVGKNVDYSRIYTKASYAIINKGIKGETGKEFLYLLIKKINVKKEYDIVANFMNYASQFGDDEMKETAKKFSKISDTYQRLYDNWFPSSKDNVTEKKENSEKCSITVEDIEQAFNNVLYDHV